MKIKLIGRPPDLSSEEYKCPRCNKPGLRKSGFHKGIKGDKRQQKYICKSCYFVTVRPIKINE